MTAASSLRTPGSSAASATAVSRPTTRAPNVHAVATLLTILPSYASALEQPEQPLPNIAQNRRQQHPGDKARQSERPSEQRRLVGEHADRAYQSLRGQERNDGPRLRTGAHKVRGDRKQHVRAAGQNESHAPADEDAAAEILATQPLRHRLRRQQHFEETGKNEPQRDFNPHAAQQAAARRDSCKGQVWIALKRHHQPNRNQPQENVETRVQFAPRAFQSRGPRGPQAGSMYAA